MNLNKLKYSDNYFRPIESMIPIGLFSFQFHINLSDSNNVLEILIKTC